jgi:hypothetical protein
MMRPPFLTPIGQVSRKFSGLTIWTVNVSINGFVAGTNGLAFKKQLIRDLFGRPTFFELRDNGLSHTVQPHQFPASRTPLRRSLLGNYAVA